MIIIYLTHKTYNVVDQKKYLGIYNNNIFKDLYKDNRSKFMALILNRLESY